MPIFPYFSDDGSRLVSVNYKGSNLNLWDASTGRLIRRQPLTEGPKSCVRVPGVNRVAVGCGDGSVRLFPLDVSDQGLWNPTLVMRDVDSTIHHLATSRDGTVITGFLAAGERMVWRIDALPR